MQEVWYEYFGLTLRRLRAPHPGVNTSDGGSHACTPGGWLFVLLLAALAELAMTATTPIGYICIRDPA